MKPSIAILVAMLLAVALTGCRSSLPAIAPDSGQQAEQPTQEEMPEPEQPAEDSSSDPLAADPEDGSAEDDSVPENTPTEETEEDAPQTPTSEELEASRQTLTDWLNAMRQNVPVGTAGSSLAAANQAAQLLDWGMETPLSTEEIQATVTEWYESLDAEDQEEALLQLSGVAGAIQQLTGETGADLLDTAGCTDSAYPWNETAVQAAEAVVTP